MKQNLKFETGKRECVLPRYLLSIELALFSLIGAVVFPASAHAADWGYEGVDAPPAPPAQRSIPVGPDGRATSLPPLKRKESPSELRARAGSLGNPEDNSSEKGSGGTTIGGTTIGGTGSANVGAPGGSKAPLAPTEVVTCWLELLGLVAPVAEAKDLPDVSALQSSLMDDQKGRFTEALSIARNGKDKLAIDSISSFWPLVKKKIADEDQLANYRLLFRALLRHRSTLGSIDPAEKEMLREALGPERVAVSGDPPLTEAAITAYTDMACFLYSQKNPALSVDADDNRELFEKVIRMKFQDAPSKADKAAMNNFPLSWARFRILYTDATPAMRKTLEKRTVSEAGLNGLEIQNPPLEKVLKSQLWRSTFTTAGGGPAKAKGSG